MPETVIICQMLNWTQRSMTTEISMIKPKLVVSCWVKTVVWVRNPGPTAEVAIKKAAPKRALVVVFLATAFRFAYQ